MYSSLNPFVIRATLKLHASRNPLKSTDYTAPSQLGFLWRFLILKNRLFLTFFA